MIRSVVLSAAIAFLVLPATQAAAGTTTLGTLSDNGLSFSWTQSPDKLGGNLVASGDGVLAISNEPRLLPAGWEGLVLPVHLSYVGSAANSPVPQFNNVQRSIEGDFALKYTGADLIIDGILLSSGATLFASTLTNGTMVPHGYFEMSRSDAPFGERVFTSDLFDLEEVENFGYFTFRPTTKIQWNPGESYQSFSATAITAVFSAVIPEPATWALMILGFGILGGATRRKMQHAV